MRAWLIGLALACLATATARAEVIIVYDASNSMWGQVEGRHKIEIAREVMGDLVADWDPAEPLGLIAYGHRREGDCSDIEVVVQPGPLDPAAFVAKVEGLVPRGKTPLTDAVRQAAELLRYRAVPATVVLLSDGIETCDADPCAVAAELEAAGVAFTAHVVGFDVAGVDEQAQLRCIADNTGGIFRTAADSGELRDALAQVAEAAVATPVEPQPVPEPEAQPEPEALPEATLAAAPTVDVAAAIEVAWTGPGAARDYVAIAGLEQRDNQYINYTYAEAGSPLAVTAPAEPGLYELRYVERGSNAVLARLEIEVVDVAASLAAPEIVQAGSPVSVGWTGPAYDRDYVSIAAADQNPGAYVNYTYVNEGSPLVVTAPADPGLYEVRYVLREGPRVLARRAIEVAAAAATLDAPLEAPAGSEVAIAWTGPGHDRDFVSIAAVDQNPGAYVNYTYVSEGSPLTVTAPADPGLYEIRYVLREGPRVIARRELEVTPLTVTLDAGDSVAIGHPLEVSWSGPGYDRDYIAIAEPGQRPGQYLTYTYVNEGSPLSVEAPLEPGLYELRYVLREGPRVLHTREIEVVAATATLVAPDSVAPGQGFAVEVDGPLLARDEVVLVPADAPARARDQAQRIARGSTLQFVAPAEGGLYELRYLLHSGGPVIGRRLVEVAAFAAALEAPDRCGRRQQHRRRLVRPGRRGRPDHPGRARQCADQMADRGAHGCRQPGDNCRARRRRHL
ncbi:MAG: VWA domain-containing protein [Geminicoccaceae bacterium]